MAAKYSPAGRPGEIDRTRARVLAYYLCRVPSRRGSMHKVVKGLAILGVLAGGAEGGYAWLAGRDGNAGGLKLVEIASGGIVEKAVAIGKIEPRLKFRVKSKLPGIVRASYFEVGDTVRAGEVLFNIVPDPTPTELSDAQRNV